MRKLFGTDGVRGLANHYPMTVEMVQRIGSAAAVYFGKNSKNSKPKIVIGKDTRLSNYMFETALTAGLCAMGADAIWLGPMPTPAIAHMTRSLRADAGIVISASHNAYHDSGIKFFNSNGFKLGDQIELELEKLALENKFDYSAFQYEKIGKLKRIEQEMGRYIEYLKNTFPKELTLDGLRIGIDAANGAAYKIAPIVFTELGAEVHIIGNKPDGININNNVGALYTKELRKLVIDKDLDLGIALDGDADRVIFIDSNGHEINGDAIIGMLAKSLIKQKKLNKNTVVATIMSNMGLDKSLKSIGGKVIKTDVGDRYVLDALRKGNYNLGGENSGHLIFRDYSTTGDGMLAALQVLAILIRSNKTLNELSRFVEIFPQVLKSKLVKEKIPLDELKDVQKKLKLIEKELGNNGRINVRYSGTEKKVRVMLEGTDYSKISEYADDMMDLFK